MAADKPLFLNDKLAFGFGGKPLFVDSANEFSKDCCCGVVCGCCSQRVRGATITVAGVTTPDGGCSGCPDINGTYWVPVYGPEFLAPCAGGWLFEGILACPPLDPIDIFVEWLFDCADGNLGVYVTIRDHTFFLIIPHVDEPPFDCSEVNGIPLEWAEDGFTCDVSGATVTIELAFGGAADELPFAVMMLANLTVGPEAVTPIAFI